MCETFFRFGTIPWPNLEFLPFSPFFITLADKEIAIEQILLFDYQLRIIMIMIIIYIANAR